VSVQATPGELAEAMVEHPLYGVLLEKQYGKNVHLNSGCGHAGKLLSGTDLRWRSCWC
jgi:hypothetical protein